MKRIIAYFNNTKKCFYGLSFIAMIIAATSCGGASSGANTSTTPASEGDAAESGAATSAEGSGNKAAKGPVCEVAENDSESNVVFSKNDDWYFTVSTDTNVSCENERGIADVELAGLHINVVIQPLTPGASFDQDMQAFLSGYMKGVSSGIPFETPPTFESRNIGEKGRQAYFSNGKFQVEGNSFYFVTSITGALNANNDGVYHVVFWSLQEADFKENEQMALETIDTLSSSWFRLSDLDDEGNLVNMW